MKKVKVKTAFAGFLLASGLLISSASAQFITIDKNTKVVFTTEIIGGNQQQLLRQLFGR